MISAASAGASCSALLSNCYHQHSPFFIFTIEFNNTDSSASLFYDFNIEARMYRSPTSTEKSYLQELVGKQVKIYWDGDDAYYNGRVIRYVISKCDFADTMW